MFKVGDQVMVGGTIAEILKVLEIAGQVVYQLLIQQPAVRTVTAQQLTAQGAQPPAPPKS